MATGEKTYPELAAQSTFTASDLLAVWRSSGPLKKVAASALQDFLFSEFQVFATRTTASAATIHSGITTIQVNAFASGYPKCPGIYKEVTDSGTLELWQFRSNTNTRRWQLVPDGEVNVLNLGAKGDGVTVDTAAFQAGLDFTGEIYAPVNTYLLGALTYEPATYTGAFGPAPRILGDGPLRTIFDTQASGPLFDLEHAAVAPPDARVVIGGHLYGFTIKSSAGTSGAIGVKMTAYYQMLMEQVHIIGLNLHGFWIPTILGDTDGSNQLLFRHCRIENCAGWGIKSDGDAGRNENSYIQVDQSFIQACGTDEYKDVTGITQANPGVVTAVAHGFSNGDQVKLFGVGGMTEVNLNTYTVAGATADTYQLYTGVTSSVPVPVPVDTSGYGAYTTGGETAPQIPGSGGMIAKGQVFTTNQTAFVACENAGLFLLGGDGLGQSVQLLNTSFENNHKRGFYSTGIINFTATLIQIYNNDENTAWVGCEFDGAFYTIEGVTINTPIVRTTEDNTPFVAFRLSGENVKFDSCRINSTAATWDNFDWPGQTRFEGWQFAAIPQQCCLTTEDTTTTLFRPNQTLGSGATSPLRLRGPNNDPSGAPGVASTSGEWVPTQIPNDGLVLGLSGLAASKTYNVYLYDVAGVRTLVAHDDATDSVVTDPDSGYPVRSTDATKLYVGRVATDGGTLFVIADMSWLNPLQVPGRQAGVNDWQWFREADTSLYHKYGPALPSSATDGFSVILT